MTFKTFLIALLGSFAFPWLALVVIPFGKMRNVEPVFFTEKLDGRDDVYVPRRAGRIADGAAVYGANGCYVCHSQLIRPSFAGSELGRPGWAGFVEQDDAGVPVDTRRETTVYDYTGERFAQIGLTRNGPDLSNVGNRIERYVKAKDADITDPEAWVFNHLYNPRSKKETYWSKCPSQHHLFEVKKNYGPGSDEALLVQAPDGMQVVPEDEARALTSYLLSLKKDDPVPYSINYNRDKQPAN